MTEQLNATAPLLGLFFAEFGPRGGVRRDMGALQAMVISDEEEGEGEEGESS